ncbi:transposable element Tc3 Transposase [Phytophthora palmivora]|uniref:Transposable element Tc3 Transposase n=1 Tax=Phytophthora palmivora TaxID=4796 RepID=A0A2P4YEP3_9STRA|nr:transposable element Tc3 Transposase [Phytophthora palmivora]
MVHEKRVVFPVLKPQHIADRQTWAIQYVEHGCSWNSVLFLGEEKCNLDSPDGYQYYWRDLRKKNPVVEVCFWESFSVKGKSEMAIFDGNQNNEKYIDTLGDYLLPFAHLFHGVHFKFEQDNASSSQQKLATDLVNALEKAWDAIPTSTLEKLVTSMKKRCMEVYRLRDCKTNY